MKVYNHTPQTISYSDQPFPAFRYTGDKKPHLLLPVRSKKLVDEAGALSEAIQLRPCQKGGAVAIPRPQQASPDPGSLHLARRGAGQIEVLEGEEHLLVDQRVERPDGTCTEIVFAAYIPAGARLVIRVRNRVGDPDGATFTYDTGGCTRTPFDDRPQPQPARVAPVAAQARTVVTVHRPRQLTPVMEGPVGYAHVTNLADGRPVWVALAGLQYAIGADPYQADTVDVAALGELLDRRPAAVAPAAYALGVTAAAAQWHADTAA
ncbi:MAG: hypothetical protein KKA73_18540 [Chloroflexi bacterium]|nr:hypothetical protein [Chloroflexota bacterium]MBU1749687.1 hypothetical protein [Chloroflexota bacterium]